MKKNIAASFIVNIMGLVSLFFIDTHISKSNNIELISSWALTKSILFIGILFILLGLDQAIVRMKLKLQDIFTMALIQFAISITIIATLLYLFDFKLNIALISLSMFFLSVSYLLYSFHRLNMHYIKAQLFLQGWKIVLFFVLILASFNSLDWLLPLSIVGVLFIFGFKDIISSLHLKYFNLTLYKETITTGLHYFVSLMTLTVSLYIDQILLNYDAKTIESSQLFAHVTFFISPVAIFLGFSGFILGPYLRNNPKQKITFFKNVIWKYLLVGLLLSGGSFFTGELLFSYFKPETHIYTYLSMALSGIVFLRYLYILPSAYIGSFANNHLIRKVSTVNLLGILLYLVAYFVISRETNNYLLAITASMIIVWLMRVIIGYYAIFLIFKKDHDESI